jgi:hypothetical protein
VKLNAGSRKELYMAIDGILSEEPSDFISGGNGTRLNITR